MTTHYNTYYRYKVMKIRKNFIINFTNLKMTIYYLFHSIYVKMDKICFNTCIFNFYITLTHISACFISLSATSKTNKPLRQKPMAIHKSNSLPRSNPRAENKINSPAAAREYYKQTPRLNVRN